MHITEKQAQSSLWSSWQYKEEVLEGWRWMNESPRKENDQQHHSWPPCLKNPAINEQGESRSLRERQPGSKACVSLVSFILFSDLWMGSTAFDHRAHIPPPHFHTPKFSYFLIPFSPPLFVWFLSPLMKVIPYKDFAFPSPQIPFIPS